MDWKKFGFEYRFDTGGKLFQHLVNIEAYREAALNLVLPAEWSEQLDRLNRIRAVYGTTRLEGNPLSEAEVSNQIEIAEGKKPNDQGRATKEQLQIRNSDIAQSWTRLRFAPETAPITKEDLLKMHEMLTRESDEKNNVPGRFRTFDVQVGSEDMGGVHKGAPSPMVEKLMDQYFEFLQSKRFNNEHPVIRALLAHFFLVTIHPFGDGNGRTARALEALLLQRAGLKDTLFIAMSNYYHEEREKYLDTLAQVRAGNCNLTPFLKFGLRGITQQCGRLYKAIRDEVSKEIFRNLTRELFVRLESTRKRVIVRRQLSLLDKLLNIEGAVEFSKMVQIFSDVYKTRKNPVNALIRDLNRLSYLGAIRITKEEKTPNNPVYYIAVVLDWPTQITETEFFAKLAHLPKSKTYGFLSAEET